MAENERKLLCGWKRITGYTGVSRLLSATEGKRDMRLDPLRLRAMSEAEKADVVGARYA